MGASRSGRRWVGALLALSALVLCTERLVAQAGPTLPAPGEDVYEIRLTDGSTLFARITSVEGETVVLTTAGGIRVDIERSQIAALTRAEGQIVSDEFWRADPNATRLFFSSTGRALEGGSAYFGTYLIVLPFVAVGITDRLSIAAGAPLLLGEAEPFYIAPKLQLIRTEAAQVSIGTIHFVLSDDFDDTDVGLAYGVGTFGSTDNALSIGLGFGYAGGDFESQPAAMIGGELRASRRVKLLAESYFLPGETGAVVGLGFRFIGERFSADVGVGGAGGGGDSFCCVPLASMSYSFGSS